MKIWAAVALIPLLVLPNFLFLVPINIVANASSVPSAQPELSLPPGKIISHNAAGLASISIANDIQGIASDMASKNAGAFSLDFLNLAVDIGNGIFRALSPATLIEIAILEGLWTFGTAGFGQVADFAAAGVAAGVFTGIFMAKAWYAYQNSLGH